MADPKLAEIRRQMAARYAQTPQAEKPHIKLCDACGQPEFQAKVCPATGLLHELDKKHLIGGVATEQNKHVFTGAELMGAIDAARVKWQKARTNKMKIDSDSASIFQTFVFQRQWKHQRFGVCYGKYDKEAEEVSVHCIYEPEQSGNELTFDLLPDPRQDRVDTLAALLGLQRVGIIMTTPPRDSNDAVLLGKELLLLAKEQSRFGDHCVLMTISPNADTQQINATAWQATQQCVRLFQLGILTPSTEDPRKVHSTKDLEVAQEDEERGKRKCIIKEPASEVDARWMTAPCAVESFTSDIVANRFIRISRPGEMPPNVQNLKNFLSDPKRNRLPFHAQIADFHVLIFLMESTMDLKSDMPIICDGVLRQGNDRMAGYEDLVKSMMRNC